MKTIEERADEYARIAQNCERCGEDECLQEKFRCNLFRRVYYAFINGAKEQKEIYINKACEWFESYLAEIGYPDDWCRDSEVQESGEKRFRKAMEE